MTFKTYDDLFTARAPELELKADAEGRIEGYASTFGGEADHHGDVVAAGAFKASLARRQAAADMPVMLWAHEQGQPVGRWTDFAEDAKGLHVRGSINLKTTRGKDAFEHVRAGDATGLSIGFRIPEGGRTYSGKGAFLLSEVDLFEVSIVALPANPKARITGHKALGSKAEAIDMLRACGLPRKAAERFAAGGWKALGGEDHEARDASARKLAAALDRATQAMRTTR